MSDIVSTAKDFSAKVLALRAEIGKVVVGQHEVIDALINAVFCHGHVLMVGVPGLAKTLLVKTLSETMDLSFNRIQFTPDLMPSDIVGSEILDDARQFHFVKGPIFSNIILADEINRTPPKTQAALLEAMQERQVTAGGQRYQLEEPFFVLTGYGGRTKISVGGAILCFGDAKPYRTRRYLSLARSAVGSFYVSSDFGLSGV